MNKLAVVSIELRLLYDETIGNGVSRDEFDGQYFIFGMLHIRELTT